MSTLPQLERELRTVAQRRISAQRRWRLRRTGPAALLVGAALVTGAAADGWLTLERGQSDRGPYNIRSAPPGAADPPAARSDARAASAQVTATRRGPGQVCLELQVRGLRPSYGCGASPSSTDPLGLVIVDANVQRGHWLVYGLADSTATTVQVGRDRMVLTQRKPGLDGRFFSALVPTADRVWVAAHNASGEQIATVGSRTRTTARPTSRAQARALGYLAGFAPTVRPASLWVYRGREIEEADAARLGLSCVENESPIVHCFKSASEANAHGTK